MPKRPSQSDDPIESARHVLDQLIAKHDPASLTDEATRHKTHSRPPTRQRKSKEQRLVGNPKDLRIIGGARRLDSTDVANQWEFEIRFYPPRNNDSIFPLLRKIESKGIRLALRNPHPVDAITIAILTGSGASLIKSLCGSINIWLKGRGQRKVSITGHGFRIETTGFSPTDIAELIKLVTPTTKGTALLKRGRREAKPSKTVKKKSVRARK